MKCAAYAVLAAWLTVLICATPVRSEPARVTAEGVADIQQGNVVAARDAAVGDALRRAVQQVVGTLVESQTLVENMQLVADKIHTRTRGYVTQYRIMTEKQEQTLYRVTVDASVDRNVLGHDLEALGLVYQRAGKPRVMVLLAETQGGVSLTELVAETEVTRLLVQNGFTVIDQVLVGNIRQSDQAKQALRGDLKAAQLLGQQLGAEVLIVGNAIGETAMRGGPLAGMISARARLQAKAIRADTGEVLASDGAAAPGVDISEAIAGRKAISAAASRWVEAALPALLSRWTRESGGDNTVQLVVTGLTLPQLDRFKNAMKVQVPTITGFQQRSFAANVASLDVEGGGTGQSLASVLGSKSLTPFIVEVITATAHRIEVRVQSQ